MALAVAKTSGSRGGEGGKGEIARVYSGTGHVIPGANPCVMSPARTVLDL